MAQAEPKSTERELLMKRHFALGEEQQYKLNKIERAVAGLQALAHNGDLSSARDQVEIAREDLAAIFELIGSQIALATTDMPFITSH